MTNKLLLLHGAGNTGSRFLSDFTSTSAYGGVLSTHIVVAPDGVQNVWALPGPPDDVDFVGTTLVDARWPKVGQPRSSHYEGEGYALVRGDTTDDAVAALRRLITGIEIRFG